MVLLSSQVARGLCHRDPARASAATVPGMPGPSSEEGVQDRDRLSPYPAGLPLLAGRSSVQRRRTPPRRGTALRPPPVAVAGKAVGIAGGCRRYPHDRPAPHPRSLPCPRPLPCSAAATSAPRRPSGKDVWAWSGGAGRRTTRRFCSTSVSFCRGTQIARDRPIPPAQVRPASAMGSPGRAGPRVPRRREQDADGAIRSPGVLPWRTSYRPGSRIDRPAW